MTRVQIIVVRKTGILRSDAVVISKVIPLREDAEVARDLMIMKAKAAIKGLTFDGRTIYVDNEPWYTVIIKKAMIEVSNDPWNIGLKLGDDRGW